MTFGAPLWLWGLLALPALAFFFARAEQAGAERLQRFVAARLLSQLAGTVNRGRRIFRFILLLLALAFVIVSLARPRWGYVYDEVKRKGLDLLLAVDVSRSMLSNDVEPSRLERVRLAAQDLINDLQGDRVGLIAFAGRAFLQAPLTIDYDAAIDSINELDTKIIPEGGTNISGAIALATRTFGKSATGNRALIIFTDGEELSGDAVDAAKIASDAGVRIFTVGVGTPGGSLIPIPGDNGGTAFVKDAQGQIVKSKLDETRLREIAKATNGSYLHLDNGPRTMQQLFSEGLAKMKVADINARLSRRPIERYEWPLSAAIFFFALALLINDRRRIRGLPETGYELRKSKPLQSVALLLFSLGTAHSLRAASAGIELYDRQQYPEAYEHFQKTLQENPGTRQTDRIQFDAGAAAYKMKDYNKALQSFSQALLSQNPHLQAESHYNLGNTLYERGEAEKTDEKKLTNWESALQHYQETLKAEPQDKNAKDNYEYVKKKIEELKKKQQKPPPQPPTPSPSPSPSPPTQKNQNKNQQQQQQNQQQQQKDKQQQQSQGGSGNGGNRQNNQQSPTPTPTPTPPSGSSPSPSPNESPSPSPSPSPSSSPSPSPSSSPSPSPTPTPGQSPSPSASASPTPTPGESPAPSASGSPTPTPGEGSSPTPTPGSEGETPTPTPGSNGSGENGGEPTPSPAGTPNKPPPTGAVRGADEEKPKEKPEAAAAEIEPEKPGEMSPKQAEQLLQAMKDEEAKVQLDEHRTERPVYKDW